MYSNKDLITLNEVQNDGKTIHLYFNTEVGLYVAYGFSAFFASHIVDVITSFSEDLQMPVALIRMNEVEELRLSTCMHPQDSQNYYYLELKHEIPLDDYTRWANSTKGEGR